ncbi:chemotaxis protein CheW [Candidatus Parcubacteria bacterium]|nr:MAG: chemotaxis protein CheW [Candidatus Parcubacteria bacterium]
MPIKTHKFILFHLADDTFAVPLLPSAQFIAYDAFTLIPGVLDKVLGLIYHSGKVVTLLDTVKILAIKSKRVRSNNCLLFDYQGDYYALEVDEGDITVKAQKILLDRSKKRFKKYIKVNNKKVYILDLEDLWKEVKIYD